VTGTAAALPAFGASVLNDNGNHRMKVIANGTDVKLYLDDVYGATVPFPFSDVNFAFGTYVGARGDEAYGYWDNASITAAGGTNPTGGNLHASLESGKVVIRWTGNGVLQSTTDLKDTGTVWTDVTPPPTGNSYTVTPSASQHQFFKLR